MFKTHTCGELRKNHIGTEVSLAGWVDRRRDHGKLIFIDLRDREGVTQVVFNPEISKSCHEIADDMRPEYAVRVTGEVAARPQGTENPRLPTGDIEIIAGDTAIFNPSKTPPFYINEETEVDENLRLKYRYLDLRRPRMQHNLILRHRLVKFLRDFLDARGFIEVETPLLLKSTPEGARDYLVPSRLHPGKFYALPQSPQQLKQLLMVAGIEKYFQIAKCLRDEDTRADRQPEFTQLDLEMSFIEEEDILTLMEELLTDMIKMLKPELKLLKPFPRVPYSEAMERYGVDKPDLRFGLHISDLSDIAAQSEFSVFRTAITAGGKVKGICAPGCGNYSRHQLEELNELARNAGAKGLLTIALGSSPGKLDALTTDMVRSVASKYLTLDQVKAMANRLNAGLGDLLLIIADQKPKLANTVLGELRIEIGRRLKLAPPDLFAIAFVIDFPLFDRDQQTGRWQSMHHPFTSPRVEDIPLLDTAPEKVHGRHYDIVCNGYEIAGGSIRINISQLQRKVFKIMGYGDKEVDELFGHLLEAFEYGAPPHGGIAAGIDRIVMLLTGEPTIREVIAFPKNQNAQDLTFNSPAPVSEQQLADLHIRLREEIQTEKES